MNLERTGLVNHNVSAVRFGIEIVEAAKQQNLLLRLCGSAAIWIHCPGHHGEMIVQGRRIADLDFVSSLKQRAEVQRLLIEGFGFKIDPGIAAIPELRRSIFYRMVSGQMEYRCDVHYDRMEYCHVIDLAGRLAADYPTIPMAELLLSKLQIRQLSERDSHDIEALLTEHELSSGDQETINTSVIAAHASRDWGLSKTVLENIQHLRQTGGEASPAEGTAGLFSMKLERLERLIHSCPKSWNWKIRSWIGAIAPWSKWYEDVDDVVPPGLHQG